MNASIVDPRRRTREILRALDRNEPVTIFYRGREKGVLLPRCPKRGKAQSVRDHPAFGMWKDHEGFKDVQAGVRALRKGRVHDV